MLESRDNKFGVQSSSLLSLSLSHTHTHTNTHTHTHTHTQQQHVAHRVDEIFPEGFSSLSSSALCIRFCTIVLVKLVN